MNRTKRWMIPFLALTFAIIGAGIVSREHPAHAQLPSAVGLTNTPSAIPDKGADVPAPSQLDSNELARDSAQTAVVALLSTLRSGEDEGDMQELVAELAKCQDRAWVARVVVSMPNPSSASYLANRLAQIWGTTSPVDTVAWIERLPVTIDRAPAMVTVHRLWAEKDPGLAASHALQLSAADGRQASLTATLSSWIQQDSAAAAAWIAHVPPDRALDATAAEIARMPGLVRQRAETAVRWAKMITDEGQRIQSLETVFSLWADHDPFAASAYVRTSTTLTEDERARIREAVHLPE